MLIAHYKTKRNVCYDVTSYYKMTFLAHSCVLCVQVKNEVVLWDKIIKRGDIASISVTGIKSKYSFFDDGFGLL